MKYVGVDIGGSHLRVGLVDRENGLQKFESFSVPESFEDGVQIIINTVKKFDEKIEGIGLGLPGDITEEGVADASNLPQWNNQPVRRLLSDELKVPVFLFHDVAAAALGEYVFGSIKLSLPCIYFIWGTGVGGCQLAKVNEKIHISSFEVGHHVIVLDGKECVCGQRGCVETYIGGRSLAAMYGDLSQKTDEDQIWKDASKYASQAVKNTLAFFSAKQIIFGGGVVTKRPFLIELVREELTKKETFIKTPPMSLSSLEDQAGILGAAAACWIEQI
jgi:glucokinase